MVILSEKEPENCWEFMKCPKEIREKCDAYILNSGDECWFLSDIKNSCLRRKKGESCLDCPFFKKHNPNF